MLVGVGIDPKMGEGTYKSSSPSPLSSPVYKLRIEIQEIVDLETVSIVACGPTIGTVGAVTLIEPAIRFF